MELKKGFKQTEIGTVPDDWECLDFNTLFQCKQGVQTPIEKQFLTNGQNRKRFIRIIDLTNPNELPRFIDDPGSDHHVNENDLFMVRYGSPGLIGFNKQGVIANNLFRLLPKKKTNNHFYFHYFRSRYKDILEMSGSSTMPAISFATLANFKVVQPRIEEQEAIANALFDADAYIESLEKLIAKKRLIKKGVMHELLTGNRRLEGFKNRWKAKKLSELADIRSGGTPSTTQSQFWDGKILWCTPTDVTQLNGQKYLSSTARTITDLGLKNSSAEIIPANSIVMTSRATIGECAINILPVTTNQGFKNFIPNRASDLNFLYYLLTTQKQGFISLCAGSTFLEISKNQLAQYEVQIPEDLNEQMAIGHILSDLDSDIFINEDRLLKAQLLKQGMMQELLTGRIRLI